MRRALLVLAALAFVAPFPCFPQEQDAPLPVTIVEPDHPDLARCWISGAGPKYFQWCISVHGNLQIKSPDIAGAYPVALVSNFDEGYVVSSSQGVHGCDAGRNEQPWGAVSVTYPSATSALVTRTTADGKVKLDMKYTRDLNEYDVTIQTTVTNISGSQLTDVQVVRYARMFFSGPGLPDGYARVDRGDISLWARPLSRSGPDSRPFGVSLSAPSVSTAYPVHTATDPYSWFLEAIPDWCNRWPTLFPFDEYPVDGDRVLWLGYVLGQLNPGQRKTVKFVYRRQ